MLSIYKHLLDERHMYCLNRYRGVSICEDERIATFPLWAHTGKMVGFQQYRPDADKTKRNNPREGRYFTKRRQEALAFWGLESTLFATMRKDVLFVCEGIFDACRFHNFGYQAIATLSNNPLELKGYLKVCGYKTIAICDPDDAGRKLAKLADKAIFCESKDPGAMTTSEFIDFFSKINNML